MFGDLKVTFTIPADSVPLVVTHSRWINPAPRANPSSLESDANYAQSGNLIHFAPSFEIRPFWTINNFMTADELDILMEIWDLKEERIRAKLSCFVEIDDETAYVYEHKTAMTKTRTEVSGTSVISTVKGVKYFARWQAFMPRKPVAIPEGNGWYSVVYTLQETGVKI
jgi:hypothetical protein